MGSCAMRLMSFLKHFEKVPVTDEFTIQNSLINDRRVYSINLAIEYRNCDGRVMYQLRFRADPLDPSFSVHHHHSIIRLQGKTQVARAVRVNTAHLPYQMMIVPSPRYCRCC